MLATLLDAGFVEREPGTQRWQLGLRLVHLGNAALARLDLRDLARPLLEQLVRDTGETATLSLPAQGEGVTVDFAPSPHSVSSRAEIGRASVAHATAVGKLVLAHTPGALAALAEPLERYTPRTLTTLAEIERAVAEVRTAGVAEAAGEREPGLNAIAAPVLADDGRLVAVLGLQGPERFDAEARRAAARRWPGPRRCSPRRRACGRPSDDLDAANCRQEHGCAHGDAADTGGRDGRLRVRDDSFARSPLIRDDRTPGRAAKPVHGRPERRPVLHLERGGCIAHAWE